MTTIFSLKSPSGLATDAIDTVNHNVFKNVDSSKIKFIEKRGILNKIMSIWRLKPEYLLGIGSVSEIFYVLLKPRSTQYIIGWHAPLRRTKAWPVRKILFNETDLVVAVSDCVAKTVAAYFPQKKIFTVLNGVDMELFNPNKKNKKYINKKFSVDFGKPVVLFVGALFERKRPDVFIEVASRYPKANFVLVGKKDKKNFVNSARGLKNFQWIPFMDREDISIMMASSDIFLFPSINEPCAAVIPEALGSSLPVLLSNSCGNKELIIHGKEGFLVDQSRDEVGQFINYLDELFGNSRLMEKMRKNAKERCAKELNWKKVAEKYEEIILTNK